MGRKLLNCIRLLPGHIENAVYFQMKKNKWRHGESIKRLSLVLKWTASYRLQIDHNDQHPKNSNFFWKYVATFFVACPFIRGRGVVKIIFVIIFILHGPLVRIKNFHFGTKLSCLFDSPWCHLLFFTFFHLKIYNVFDVPVWDKTPTPYVFFIGHTVNYFELCNICTIYCM